MKPLAILMTALALTVSNTVGASFAAEDVDGAKGLFFKQLDQPSANMNTGIQYWIELRKGGKTIRANNKTAFHSGDAIRFHLTANIDGYAYIVLRSGSRGEQEVLFPVPERKDDNRISRGQEVVLPQDGSLAFDDNPGTEKIGLIVSREPIDTTSLVMPETDKPVRIAMADSGSKDLIPNRVYVAYDDVPASRLAGLAEASKASSAQSSTKESKANTSYAGHASAAKPSASGSHSSAATHTSMTHIANSGASSDTTAAKSDKNKAHSTKESSAASTDKHTTKHTRSTATDVTATHEAASPTTKLKGGDIRLASDRWVQAESNFSSDELSRSCRARSRHRCFQ